MLRTISRQVENAVAGADTHEIDDVISDTIPKARGGGRMDLVEVLIDLESKPAG